MKTVVARLLMSGNTVIRFNVTHKNNIHTSPSRTMEPQTVTKYHNLTTTTLKDSYSLGLYQNIH